MIVTGFRSSSTIVSKPILTVAQLTGLIRTSIETQFSDVWVEGEISNLRTPPSGHLYCTLKDQNSQIRAVMFRSSVVRMRFALGEGMQVIVRGRLTLYEPRGEYQIVIEVVEPKGIGALQLAFEQLKSQLMAEGLFDPAKKKSLPLFPRTVGVITSLSGAAIRDILAVLHRRWPTLHVIIVPVPVQGDGAASQIASAVRCLNNEGLADVIILGRGGGSLEDLWSFNEEIVVRAVAGSRIPIVAAVGHEVDVTLTDFAADVRAPTPSVAAEFVVPVRREIVERLGELSARMKRVMVRHCLSERRRLESERWGLLQFRFRIQGDEREADDLTSRLSEALRSRLSNEQNRLSVAERGLAGRSPLTTIKRSLVMMTHFFKRLDGQIRAATFQRRLRVEGVIGRLNNLSPLAILGRGYSILSRIPGGDLVKRAGDVKAGDELSARLMEGRLHCTVKRVAVDTPSV